jgi:spermidine dehydrogenase
LLSRTALFNMSYSEIERRIRRQLASTLGPYGFDHKRDIAALITNRWGHGYVVPGPGFFFGSNGKEAPREIVRRGYGKIRFSHSELTGVQLWPNACKEGARAAQEVLALGS